MNKTGENNVIENKVDVDELRQECKKIENEYQEFEETMTAFKSKESEYCQGIQSEMRRIESLREDCSEDKELLALIDEQHEKMKKAEQTSEELQETIQSEMKKAESEAQEALSTLRKQIDESEV